MNERAKTLIGLCSRCGPCVLVRPKDHPLDYRCPVCGGRLSGETHNPASAFRALAGGDRLARSRAWARLHHALGPVLGGAMTDDRRQLIQAVAQLTKQRLRPDTVDLLAGIFSLLLSIRSIE